MCPLSQGTCRREKVNLKVPNPLPENKVELCSIPAECRVAVRSACRGNTPLCWVVINGGILASWQAAAPCSSWIWIGVFLDPEDTVSETLQKEKIQIPGSRLPHSAAVHTHFNHDESSLYAAACAWLTIIYTQCTEKSQTVRIVVWKIRLYKSGFILSNVCDSWITTCNHNNNWAGAVQTV